MLLWKDLKEKINNSISSYEKTGNTLNMSSLSICGFKYRYEIDNHIKFSYTLNYDLGNGFEYSIIKNLSRYANIIAQYKLQYEFENYIVIGKTDAYDIDTNTIYEIKFTFSYSNFDDIYLRQLKAYMINKKANGILWIYQPLVIKNNIKEKVIDYNSLSENDLFIYELNIKAFTDNRYYEGIENSLCGLCQNINCPIYKNMHGDKSENI
jgi:hypothetical protein